MLLIIPIYTTILLARNVFITLMLVSSCNKTKQSSVVSPWDDMDIAWRLTTLLLVTLLASTQLIETNARRRVNRQAPSSISSLSLSWSHLFNGTQLRVPRHVSRGIRKRHIVLGDFKLNQAYQSCIMPGDKPGRCRHLQHCMLEDFRDSFPRFLDYLCVIERSYVGVCCPDKGGFLPASGASSPEISSPMNTPGDENRETVESETTSPTKSHLRGCGVSSMAASRVVGGHVTTVRQYPWVAALLHDGDTQYCAGVLVTDRHVLTAAHCVHSFQASDIKVRLGEYDFDQATETRSRDFQVIEIRSHVDFQKDTYENDIAVLKLHRPASFDTYIWPICLPPPDRLFENETAIVTGWGTQFFGGPTSNVLMEVPVPVWEQARCEPRFTQPILDTMLCAAEYEGGKDACQGDSGGPLLYKMANKRWATIGVVSWGIRCGEAGLPGVYTRVNRYLSWIFSNCVF